MFSPDPATDTVLVQKKPPTVLCHKTEALPAEAANFSIMIYVFGNDINFS